MIFFISNPFFSEGILLDFQHLKQTYCDVIIFQVAPPLISPATRHSGPSASSTIGCSSGQGFSYRSLKEGGIQPLAFAKAPGCNSEG